MVYSMDSYDIRVYLKNGIVYRIEVYGRIKPGFYGVIFTCESWDSLKAYFE
jgi:hypothetical protein